jgi:hypothetical protein
MLFVHDTEIPASTTALSWPSDVPRKVADGPDPDKQKPIPSEFAIRDKNCRSPKPRRSVTSHHVYARSKEPGLRENTAVHR